MTPQARMRRIGWFAALAICTALYAALHFQVWSVSSQVKKTERQIVALEEQNMLLETEFLTRSSQIQLAAWNRVDFGYSAPDAAQFIENERQLDRFGSPRAEGAPDPIRLAGNSSDQDAPPFPQLVSPLTGRPIDVALVEPAQSQGGMQMGTTVVQRTLRIPLAATAAVAMGGAGQ